MNDLLMIPGPVETPDAIIEAFNGQTVAHYGEEFRDLYVDTVQRLSRVLGSSGWSFLIPGSGSTALEAIGTNYCSSKKCLILNNGHFGDRIHEIASRHSSKVEQLIFEKGKSYDLEVVEAYLREGGYDLVWMVHVDTSIGILNPLKEVAALAKKYQARVFVDAIASGGIEEINMDAWGIDGVANATQKGFSCPAGFGLLTLSKELVEDAKNKPPNSWYLDVGVWVEYYHMWNDWHPYPVSLPTNLVKALNKSLELIEKEGIDNRVAAYRDVSERVIRAVRRLGLDLFVPQSCAAHGLTAVTTLETFDAAAFIAFLKQKFRIQIGGSLDSKMKSSVFRIGHMSTKQCLDRNLCAVIGALAAYMKHKNIEVDAEGALSALM